MKAQVTIFVETKSLGVVEAVIEADFILEDNSFSHAFGTETVKNTVIEDEKVLLVNGATPSEELANEVLNNWRIERLSFK